MPYNMNRCSKMLLMVERCEVTVLIELEYRHNEAQVEAAALIAPPGDLFFFSSVLCVIAESAVTKRLYTFEDYFNDTIRWKSYNLYWISGIICSNHLHSAGQ